MSDDADADSYLASDYYDPHRRLHTRRVYYEDGRVAAFNGREWRTVCQFAPAQVEQAKAAIRASGLLTAADLEAPADLYDTAALTYTWRLDGGQGQVTNRAYPALTHPVFAALDERLDALEAAAGA